jgi:hypothetical protein
VKLPPGFVEGSFVEKVSGWVADYIQTHQELYSPKGCCLEPSIRTQLEPFFSASLLDSVRWSIEDPKIKDPIFFRELVKAGLKNLPSFSNMAAITFANVIVHRVPLSPELAFHEMVHAEQYRQLGIAKFAERYVKGFLAGGEYMEIPLEKQAYALEARFSRNPKKHFSVEEEVAEAICNRTL